LVFGLGKSKSVVGLDIGSSAVKAVELKMVGKGFKVTAFAIEPVPPDSIVDGAIIDGTAVADAIRRLFEQKAFKTKEVAASLSGNAVIVKKINLPVMTEAELAESIMWEAEQYIPFDIQDVNIDYQILDAGTGPESKGTMEVLLVAAMTENVLLEVQKTFDFLKASATSDRIDRVLLSGGASRVGGFAEALEARFSTTIESFNPFNKIAFEPAKFGIEDAPNVVPAAAV